MKTPCRLLLFAAFFVGCAKSPLPPSPGVPVTAAKVIEQDVNLYLDYVGHVKPFVGVELKSQISGAIVAKYFIEGAEVKAGDLLLTIDTRPYKAALAKAEAMLAMNLASLKYDEEKVRRYATLVQDDFIAKLDYDQYISQFQMDEALVKQNLAEIEEAKINLDYCYLKAPMEAVIGKLLVDVGNYVDESANTVLVTLNQIRPIYVDFYVPERDLIQIRTLQKNAHLKTEAYLSESEKEPIVGTLTLIDNQVNQNSGTILLEATFENCEKKLWPGEFVKVKLILLREKNALLIPTAAISYGQIGPYVFAIKEDKTVEIRKLQLGESHGEYTRVLSGLKKDETIVLEGQLNLYTNATVEILDSRTGAGQ